MRIPQPGETFGRYRIERVLGQGGMGIVFAATDLRLGRLVAIKAITGPHVQNPEFRSRFQAEAEALARVDSPYVINITDHDEIDGLPFIVTQYVDGSELGTLVRNEGTLPVRTALMLCAQVARGLADAHRRGIVHRDIKPANVLVRDAGTADAHAYVIDFGIARSDDGQDHTTTGAVAGTWAYLAPERSNGAKATPAADVYALGCVLWACITGAAPYGGSDVEIILAHTQAPVPQLPSSTPFLDEVNAVLARMMAKDPADRYPDASAARADLERLATAAPADLQFAPPAGHRPPEAHPETVVPAASTLPRDPQRAASPASGRRRWPVVAAAAVVLALLAGGAVWAALASRDEGKDDQQLADVYPGDVTGDDLGDAFIVQSREGDLDPQRTITLESDGDRFLQAQEGDDDTGFLHAGDVDGDGLQDEIWQYVNDDGDLILGVRPAAGDDWDAWTFPLDEALWGILPDILFVDVTQDGRDDLVIGNVTADDKVAIYVGEATDGGFSTPTSWYGGDLPAELFTLAAADVDGDDQQELVALYSVLPWDNDNEQFYLSTVVFSSDGKELTQHGEGARWEDRTAAWWEVGDLDRDGADELIFRSQLDGVLTVATADDLVYGDREKRWTSDLTRAQRIEIYEQSLRRVDWTTSDVDGDGDEDILRISRADDSYRIDVLQVEDGEISDPKEWGLFDCFSQCDDYFEFVDHAR